MSEILAQSVRVTKSVSPTIIVMTIVIMERTFKCAVFPQLSSIYDRLCHACPIVGPRRINCNSFPWCANYWFTWYQALSWPVSSQKSIHRFCKNQTCRFLIRYGAVRQCQYAKPLWCPKSPGVNLWGARGCQGLLLQLCWRSCPQNF